MPPIEAYEIGPDGAHMALETGDGSTRGTGVQDAAAPTQTEPPAVNGAPAPPQSTPPPESGLAAPASEEGDDSDIPETATVDYVAKRINRLNARYRAEQRAREADRVAAEQRLAQQQGQIETLTKLLQGAAPDLPPAQPTGPPQAEQYASHEDYVLAAARYGAQQELQARDQQTQAERQRAEQARMQQELMDREAAFKAQHPDFDQVLRAGLVGKVAPHVQQALMLLPEGPALAYTLAQQQDLVARLNTLPPPLVFAELGRLMPGTPPPAAPGEPTPPVQPNGTRPPPLPEPMRPVGGGGSPSPPGYREDMSQDEYRAYRARTSNLPRWKTG